MGGLMHEGLIHGPVTQVLRKGELIHYPWRGLYAVGGGGGEGGLQAEKHGIS